MPLKGFRDLEDDERVRCLVCDWRGTRGDLKLRVQATAGTGKKCPECGKSEGLTTIS